MQLETKKLSKYGISTKNDESDNFVSKSLSAQHRGKVQSVNRQGNIENSGSDVNDEKGSLINELKLNR